MKRFILPLLLFGFSTVASAQLDVLGKLTGALKSNTTSSSSKDDALTSGISSLLGSLLGNSTLSANDVQGTWNYQCIDCVFETENYLLKAGGEIAATKVEEKIDETLTKLGVKKGTLSFTFNQDKTFTINVKGRTVKGTYALDMEKKCVTLTYLNGVATITPVIVKSGKTLSLLYDADKFFNFLVTISVTLKNTTVSTISKFLSSYDGMLIGMELQQ